VPLLSRRTLVVLILRRRGRRDFCLGLLGALHPNATWSTLLHRASHVVPFRLSSGATVHLSRWPHTLQSTCRQLLHLELHRLLGRATNASTVGELGTSLESAASLGKATLLEPHHRLVDGEGDHPLTVSKGWPCQPCYGRGDSSW
jgi:hypothetical protein